MPVTANSAVRGCLQAPSAESSRITTHRNPSNHADIVWAGSTELSAWLRDRRLTVARIAETMIERIHAVNPVINAIVHLDVDRIRRDAAALDAQGAHERPLFGIPYTVKELTPVAGVTHTLGFERC